MTTRYASTCAYLSLRLLRSLAILCACCGVASAQTARPVGGGETGSAAVVAWIVPPPGTLGPAPGSLILATESSGAIA